ncbi:MAG: hypothetical protein KDA92_23630, partial [Planctomycetales bacterium]|nr:hypothetical protein [Planctomycetales bacterium]
MPSDEHGTPNADYLLLPLALQRQLYAAGALDNESAPPWVLASANYAGVFEPVEGRAQLQLNSITADFEIFVTQTGVATQFPLAAAAAQMLRREAFLDGRPIQLQWEADRAAIRLPIRQTGRHHLQLSFQTTAVTDDGQLRVSLPIPQALQSTLVLTSSQNLQSIEVPAAVGVVQRREASGQLRADLGPISELTVTWPIPTTATIEPAITQLNWLRLSRDGVRLETQLIVDMRKYGEPTLLIEAEERLQLDYPVSNQPLALSPGAMAGMRRLEFDLTEESNGQAIVQLSFNLTGATGIGHVQLPKLTVLGAATRSYLAVSSVPNLIVRIESGNGSSVSTNEFAELWGGSQVPDYAYQFTDPVSGWRCEGQWLLSPVTADLAIHYVLEPASTQVLLSASLRAEQRAIFQQRLLVPADFALQQAYVLQAGSMTVLRWSRGHGNEITLFFDAPPTGMFQIVLSGYQPAPASSERDLPRLRFVDAIQRTVSLDMYRQSSVLATFDWPSQPAVVDTPAWIRGQLTQATWLGRWELPNESQPWQVNVTPNDRRVKALLTNVVSRSQGVWVHRLLVHIETEGGILDRLTFEIPEEWKAGLQDDRVYRLTYSQASRAQMVRVTITPLEALSALQFQFPDRLIPITAGQPLSIPNIRLLETGQIERLLYLPSSIDGQSVQWRATGLER